MKPNRNALAFVAACAFVPAVVSQVAVTPTEPAAPVVKLSPFVVDSTSDRGYQATSTLAGNRIKTDLKDVAASVTVLTKEFMDDLGANTIHAANQSLVPSDIVYRQCRKNDKKMRPQKMNAEFSRIVRLRP